MSKKIKNNELRKQGSEARKQGLALQSNPYRDPSTEIVSQSMREHRAKQWEMGWKKEDVIQNFGES
ncbi:MAG: hypothetical protein GVY35_01015 [Bacteroidetes bacterium]|jgi:hypothetical protein|nr:hypothetical protein [Bacteroidota bacterium]